MIDQLANRAQEQDQLYAARLLECLQAMGKQQTNAVLLTLQGAQTITPYQRYPHQGY